MRYGLHAVVYRLQVVILILQCVIEKASRCTFRGCYLEFNVVMNNKDLETECD